jgi:integrase
LTLESYEGSIRREIAPVIGGLELAGIRPDHDRAVLIRMQRRGLSAATIAQVRGVLGSSLRQAVEEGLIPANSVAAVKRPRIRRREFHWPTPQLIALLDASSGTIWAIPLLLSVTTAARRSEILGLAWEDVDLRSGTVDIRRSVQRLPGPEPGRDDLLLTAEDQASQSQYPVPAFAVDRIRSHRRDCSNGARDLERRGDQWMSRVRGSPWFAKNERRFLPAPRLLHTCL